MVIIIVSPPGAAGGRDGSVEEERRGSPLGSSRFFVRLGFGLRVGLRLVWSGHGQAPGVLVGVALSLVLAMADIDRSRA